jgi:hypothetical protein
MRKFIRRIFCLHVSWEKDWLHPLLRLNKEQYICKDCGKIKQFDADNPPIKFIE